MSDRSLSLGYLVTKQEMYRFYQFKSKPVLTFLTHDKLKEKMQKRVIKRKHQNWLKRFKVLVEKKLAQVLMSKFKYHDPLALF